MSNHPNRSKRWQMAPAELIEAIAVLTDGNNTHFARLVGVDGRTVRRWLSGESRIEKPIQVLIKVLLVLPAEWRSFATKSIGYK